MPMVYQNLHSITRIEFFEINQLKEGGSYSRHVKFFGYKGVLSKDEGEFEFLEIVLFGETEQELKVNFNDCKK